METTRDTTLGELLDVLEDMNWHTEGVLIEAIMAQREDRIYDMCKMLVRHHDNGYLAMEDVMLRNEIYHDIRGLRKIHKKIEKTY